MRILRAMRVVGPPHDKLQTPNFRTKKVTAMFMTGKAAAAGQLVALLGEWRGTTEAHTYRPLQAS